VKIKLDENLPATLAGILARLGHDADTVVDEGLKGEPDEESEGGKAAVAGEEVG
jgi:predicted nuclease of predicted toxin-antitoxin system